MKGSPSSLLIDNKMISDPKTVANTFNNYFSSIAYNLQNKIRNPVKDFSSFLTDRNPNSFFLKPTNTTEVSWSI